MKIREICESTADDLEKSLVRYAEFKHKEHEKLHTGSNFKKAFYKGKRMADKLTNNPVVDKIRDINNWAKKHSK
jgi:hypothetical protein